MLKFIEVQVWYSFILNYMLHVESSVGIWALKHWSLPSHLCRLKCRWESWMVMWMVEWSVCFHQLWKQMVTSYQIPYDTNHSCICNSCIWKLQAWLLWWYYLAWIICPNRNHCLQAHPWQWKMQRSKWWMSVWVWAAFQLMLLHWAVDELPMILDGTLKLLLLCRTSHSPHGKFYPLAGGKEVGYIYWL